MELGILADLHWGIRNNSQSFLRYQLDYMNDCVFPVLKERKISHLIQLGDFWNSRKNLDVNTMHWVRKRFLEPIKDMDIKLYIILGNHDVYFTHSNEITSLDILKEYNNIEIIHKPTMKPFGSMKIGLIPWLANTEDIEELRKFTVDSPVDTIFGHFELNNFEVIPGHKHSGGMNHGFLKNFENVYSGHFHLKQSIDNIHYLGTPFELSWSDCETEKGWYIINTDNGRMEFLKNERPVFIKIYYDEDKYDECLKSIENVKGKIIKLYCIRKKNDTKFTEFIYQLEQKGSESFTIIDTADSVTGAIANDEGKTLIDIISDYLVETKEEDENIKKILNKLYVEGNLE